MPEGRPAIPKPLERRVKVEAGHRCAIPTCRGTSVLEVAHIVPWSQVQEHEFENLILLCAICHGRYDRDEIDRTAMRQYKANLSVLSGRYNQLEVQLLERYAREWPLTAGEIIPIAFGMDLIYENLLLDGLISLGPMNSSSSVRIAGVEAGSAMMLTDAGVAFVKRMIEARNLE